MRHALKGPQFRHCLLFVLYRLTEIVKLEIQTCRPL